jgi:nucleotide-binding universal stress UspA family protein
LAFCTVLVYLRLDEPNADLLAVARDVAAREGSAVIGVVARQAVAHLQHRGAGPREPIQHDPQRFSEQASAVEQEFRENLARASRLDWRPQLTFGSACEYVAREAGAADLIIAPLARRDRAVFPSGQAEVGDLLMRLGRPVLAVPTGAEGLVLDTAMVCWVDTREARRALADSLPLLKASKRIELVEVAEAGGAEPAGRRLKEVVAWLARHGVEASQRVEIGGGQEAQQLAGIAKTIDADLVVAGAFGHSRLREWAFGGVTRDFLLVADRCVLASH